MQTNIGISGAEYAKYGTTFDNQIVVIDKTGPTTGTIVTGLVAKVADLPPLLENIRETRPAILRSSQGGQPAADQQGGRDLPAPSGGRGQPGRGSAAAGGNADGRRGAAAGQPGSEQQSRAVADDGAKRHDEALTDVVFEPYVPQRLEIAGAQPHPTKLVQSAAMAGVEPPLPIFARVIAAKPVIDLIAP